MGIGIPAAKEVTGDRIAVSDEAGGSSAGMAEVVSVARLNRPSTMITCLIARFKI